MGCDLFKSLVLININLFLIIILFIHCSSCGQFKSLQNSVIRLENIVKQLTEKLLETELRLQSVEECDCFRSCSVNGSIHPEGSTWTQGCDICSCVRGQVMCRPIQCTVLCKNPEVMPNQCCPVCKKTCFLNGRVLQHGEGIKISTKAGNNGKCGECVCNDGKTICKQIVVKTMCPQLNCPLEQRFSKEGQCCEICAGTDFCSAGNDCHPNASCHNLNAEYVCSCNEGFEGTGKVCQDINECNQRGGTDGHHCGENSICVNTIGSHICKCIQGFKPLDKYKCIDIDECSEGLDKCNENAICVNTPGGYECQCEEGYEKEGFGCKHSLECKEMCLNGGQCVGHNLEEVLVLIVIMVSIMAFDGRSQSM